MIQGNTNTYTNRKINKKDRKDLNGNGVQDEMMMSEESKKKLVSLKKLIDTPEKLPAKKFEARNSMLTDLFENKHIWAVHNIGVAILLTLLLQTAAHDYFYKQQINFGFNLIRKGFANFHFFILIWLAMFLKILMIYFGFKCWSTIRIQQTQKSLRLKVWDILWLGLFILFIPLFMCIFTGAVIIAEQPVAASVGLLVEQVRLLMKGYAFTRSNAPRVLNNSNNHSKIICPAFGKFLYFLFAPTLVYQDDYPRNKTIRWEFAVTCFLEFLGTLLMSSLLIERFYISRFENFERKPFGWQDIIMIILSNTGPSLLILPILDYMLFHAWSNLFAELLRFSDRLFYKDWWTSSAPERYFRTWNIVTHDWIYTYVYKDFYEYVTPNSKHSAKFMAFFLSAAVHEYIASFSWRFFLPVLFVMFFGGVVFVMTGVRIKPKALGNIQLLYSYGFGVSIITTFYALEYYSRINFPGENTNISYYLLPRLVKKVFQ